MKVTEIDLKFDLMDNFLSPPIIFVATLHIIYSINTGPSDGKTVICVKFMRTQELIKEFNTIGINKTNAPMAEPDLNSCTHLICSDTYMRITNDVDFIWSNDKRQQYVECINSRRSYPHLKVI